MSDGSGSVWGTMVPGARVLIARAADADTHARAALRLAVDDAFVAPEARLDEHSRALFGALLETLTGQLETELREHATRLLTARGEGVAAEALAATAAPVIQRLARAGVLRDDDLVDECVSRVRLELIAVALPTTAPDENETPSLLARLSRSTDNLVAAAAAQVLSGESQRRAAAEGGALPGTGLPRSLHQRLLWWVAAALREAALPVAGDSVNALDRALVDAAARNLAAQDEADRLEAVVMRLAAAIDAHEDELPALLGEALRDRRLTFFAALLAHALGAPYELGRALTIDPAGDRLWLALRALEVPRDAIAGIGFLLCEADSRRDIDQFADALDIVSALDGETARNVVAPLRLHPDYRAALLALSGTAR